MNVLREDAGSPDPTRTNVNDWMLPVEGRHRPVLIVPTGFRSCLIAVSRVPYDQGMPQPPAANSGHDPNLPIAGVLSDVVWASRTGAVVVTAPPGSGKTTLIPTAVLEDLPPPGRVILLQPRRLAARAVAHRIAWLRGVPVGGEVGYQVRFDAKLGRDTRLVVETTGIMLRRLVNDVTLPGIAAVVLDEFHERSLEMDLILGLLLRLRQTVRPDLRIIVMSATLAAEPVARLLGAGEGTRAAAAACPIIHAEGRMFPVSIRYLKHGDRRELVSLVAE